MPKNLAVVDVLPKNNIVIDVLPKNNKVQDILPKNMAIDSQTTTRSYQVAHSAGVIMLSVPLILYPTAGTETQWSESGGIF